LSRSAPSTPRTSSARTCGHLSVVGFDDILIAAHTVPALTTLRMPIAAMVREAVGTAVALARDPVRPRPEPTKVVFEPTLIVRESTGRPPAEPPARQAVGSVGFLGRRRFVVTPSGAEPRIRPTSPGAAVARRSTGSRAGRTARRAGRVRPSASLHRQPRPGRQVVAPPEQAGRRSNSTSSTATLTGRSAVSMA
jgi:hypothetical protein